jgi:hypothetical protein
MNKTRRLTITDKQVADGPVAVVRHLTLRCCTGFTRRAKVTVYADYQLWARILAVKVEGDPVNAMVKTVGSGYVQAERLTPPPGVRPYPGRTEGTVHFTMDCPNCNERQAPVAVKGVFNPARECDPRCEGATGPNCECVCAGENHGVAA